MKAILRRELHAFFTGLIGPLVLAVGLLVIGIYTAVLSFSEGYANFEVVLSNTSYILLFLVPLLTMRLFASEPRQGTDKLLYALPLRPTQIVLGKYLASVCGEKVEERSGVGFGVDAMEDGGDGRYGREDA